MPVLRLARHMCWVGCILLLLAGCSRTHYRLRADRETDQILDQKTECTPWQLPPQFGIEADPRSRFFDPTPLDDPTLPCPTPQLYVYELPQLEPRDPARFRGSVALPGPPRLLGIDAEDLGDSSPLDDYLVVGAAYLEAVPPDVSVDAPGAMPLLPGEGARTGGLNVEQPGPFDLGRPDEDAEFLPLSLLKETWEILPPNCLMRMFESERVLAEYERTFHHAPLAQQLDTARRLSLEDILELALINSREYQTRKERLYQVALGLSLERYQYQLKFSATGNGTAANYTHDRSAGNTDNVLAIPTTATGDKILATGGDLLARFANDVILTFDGPNGFASDIGSELLLDISQSIFQRDIVFERLTQAERDVVYEARDFARFRKQLFRDLAGEYYSLILSYRGIEIAAMDYFSNTRAYRQSEAEYTYGASQDRTGVDQFEQRAINSQSSLTRTCTDLEGQLDRLKFTIGLPTEIPINLDLAELEELTLRDEAVVAAEQVRRAWRKLAVDLGESSLERRPTLVHDVSDLTRKLLSLMQARRRLGRSVSAEDPLEQLLAGTKVDDARISERAVRLELSSARSRVAAFQQADEQQALLIPVLGRTMDLIDAQCQLVSRQLNLAAKMELDPDAAESIRARGEKLWERYEALRKERGLIATSSTASDRPARSDAELLADAKPLLTDIDALGDDADRLTQYIAQTPEEEFAETLRQTDRLLGESKRLLAEKAEGLVPIQIAADDAMLTALSGRFDLMNQRGALADTWRQIKLAGDDLKSVLTLNASQTIRTRANMNRPFDFTFDESQTRVALAFDTPLNRKSQRNVFRQSLINYQAALRSLMEAEDNVKATIRDDLRQLQLDRQQYQIAAASTALAEHRVRGTSEQLRQGAIDVKPRDFLDAQRDHTASLIAVAREHVGYVLDRIDLFLDLELLTVDDTGFWPDLYNGHVQPAVAVQPAPGAGPAYGRLPCGVCYSAEMKRMLSASTGCCPTHSQGATELSEEVTLPEEIPAPMPE